MSHRTVGAEPIRCERVGIAPEQLCAHWHGRRGRTWRAIEERVLDLAD